MTKKMTMVLMVLALFMVGIASADPPGPSINICTDSPSVCANTNTVLDVYQGVDASVNPGLHAFFENWDTNTATYTVKIIDVDANPNTIVYGPFTAGVNTDPKSVYYAWTPTKLGAGKYRIYAAAEQDPANGLYADITVRTSPLVVPELPTSALTMVGLVGLFGLVRLRKKI